MLTSHFSSYTRGNVSCTSSISIQRQLCASLNTSKQMSGKGMVFALEMCGMYWITAVWERISQISDWKPRTNDMAMRNANLPNLPNESSDRTN